MDYTICLLEESQREIYDACARLIHRRLGGLFSSTRALLEPAAYRDFVHHTSVAFQEEQLLGALIHALDTDSGLFVVKYVAVDPDRKQQGVGKSLLAHAERFAAERDFHKVGVETSTVPVDGNVSLLEWYGRRGYHEKSRRPFYFGPRGHSLVMMVKDLS